MYSELGVGASPGPTDRLAMEVFKKTVSAVFWGERRYMIPLFQRPYVWTWENQWEPLWEDI